jgi:hypothetical protein
VFARGSEFYFTSPLGSQPSTAPLLERSSFSKLTYPTRSFALQRLLEVWLTMGTAAVLKIRRKGFRQQPE